MASPFLPECALDITQFGGEYIDQDGVVDGDLVSARSWHQNALFLREFCKVLRNLT